ncbi:MAG: HD domain-containing protein [Treponema sp.]|nr:HD domain-containing protein [Treponema sp.]
MGDFSVVRYHDILCPDRPSFLDEYIALPSLQRLGGVGLLCGTDWTPLFHNKFFYSRLDHSIGAALIVWNFTHDKRQTISALFHDIATPAFSHAMDFRNGDRIKQESTEALTHDMINGDLELSELLFRDGIYKYEIDDYHRFPVADNEIPGLSADRLEYMYPSGAALCGEWTLEEVEKSYSSVVLLKNEKGLDELGFADEESALDYTKRFLDVSLILQKGEDKIAMQLMGDIVGEAVKCGYVDEGDLYSMDERSLVARFEDCADTNPSDKFARLFRTFRGMTGLERSEHEMDGCYCISFDVKRRYVNPLVRLADGSKRIADLRPEASKIIQDFLTFNDSKWACVRYAI